MRRVPTARPVRSATSPIASSSMRRVYGTAPPEAQSAARAGTYAPMPRILLTGATGYVGGELLPELLRRGHDVRCLVRDPSRRTLPDGAQPVKGDAVSGEGLGEAVAGAEVAYYLIHSMGGKGGGFADRDRQAARNFGRAARSAGVRRVVYLGGLPSANGQGSEHLESRHLTARTLAEDGPPLAYARAAMVLGAGSSSFDILRDLVHRLPLMVTPSWVDTRSQPIAVRDVV